MRGLDLGEYRTRIEIRDRLNFRFREDFAKGEGQSKLVKTLVKFNLEEVWV